MWNRWGTIALAAFMTLPYTVLGMYCWLLFSSGGAAIGLGIAIVAVMGLGAWSIGRELWFGFTMDRLARRLAEEDLLPDTSMLPRRPSGRVEPAAADAWFDERKAELDAQPTDWRCWYGVAIAYGIAGDRSRARDSMRQAIRLSARSGGGSPATSG